MHLFTPLHFKLFIRVKIINKLLLVVLLKGIVLCTVEQTWMNLSGDVGFHVFSIFYIPEHRGGGNSYVCSSTHE